MSSDSQNSCKNRHNVTVVGEESSEGAGPISVMDTFLEFVMFYKSVMYQFCTFLKIH